MSETFRAGELTVSIADNTQAMADEAAGDAAAAITDVLRRKAVANVIFAGGESQQEFHRALAKQKNVDWARVHAFPIDEFYEPKMPAECAVGAQPRRDLYEHVPIGKVHVLDYAASDAEAERARYEKLLREHPADLACLGVGTSGHIAFNEPGQTDFGDDRDVRIIDVCEQSKRQLETDPNFRAMGTIPGRGITITVPAIMRVPTLLVLVPYKLKAAIVARLIESDVSADFPATILKTKPGARMYLDRDSAAQIGADQRVGAGGQ